MTPVTGCLPAGGDDAGMPELYGISPEWIARVLGCHLDTARRYKRTGKMPRAIARFLAVRIDGELGFVDTAWRGFKLVRGELCTPEGDTIRPGDVRAIPIRRQQLDELQRLALNPKQWELFD